MEETVVRISRRDLVQSVGDEWRDALSSLISANVIRDYRVSPTSDMVEILLTKDKAVHIQSVLELQSSQKPPDMPNNPKYWKTWE